MAEPQLDGSRYTFDQICQIFQSNPNAATYRYQCALEDIVKHYEYTSLDLQSHELVSKHYLEKLDVKKFAEARLVECITLGLDSQKARRTVLQDIWDSGDWDDEDFLKSLPGAKESLLVRVMEWGKNLDLLAYITHYYQQNPILQAAVGWVEYGFGHALVIMLALVSITIGLVLLKLLFLYVLYNIPLVGPVIRWLVSWLGWFWWIPATVEVANDAASGFWNTSTGMFWYTASCVANTATSTVTWIRNSGSGPEEFEPIKDSVKTVVNTTMRLAQLGIGTLPMTPLLRNASRTMTGAGASVMGTTAEVIHRKQLSATYDNLQDNLWDLSSDFSIFEIDTESFVHWVSFGLGSLQRVHNDLLGRSTGQILGSKGLDAATIWVTTQCVRRESPFLIKRLRCLAPLTIGNQIPCVMLECRKRCSWLRIFGITTRSYDLERKAAIEDVLGYHVRFLRLFDTRIRDLHKRADRGQSSARDIQIMLQIVKSIQKRNQDDIDLSRAKLKNKANLKCWTWGPYYPIVDFCHKKLDYQEKAFKINFRNGIFDELEDLANGANAQFDQAIKIFKACEKEIGRIIAAVEMLKPEERVYMGDILVSIKNAVKRIEPAIGKMANARAGIL